jgi:hypothetical protein
MVLNKADKWFSIYIRLRDSDNDGICKCVTCETRKPWRYMDCGHFIKRQHMATRFKETNAHGQCKKCNYFEQGNDAKYEAFIIETYGEKELLLLQAGRYQTRKLDAFQMKQLEKYYKEKAINLAKEKGLTI